MEGKAVRLRSVALDQVMTRWEWFQDPQFSRLYLGHGFPPLAYKAVEDEVLAAMESGALKGYFEVAVETTGDKRYVGNAFLRKLSLQDRSAELGVFFGPAHWDKGWGTDAVRLLTAYGFDELGLHRIWLTVFDFNPRARACFEKCGFVREGVLRDAVFSAGRFHDVHLMALLGG